MTAGLATFDPKHTAFKGVSAESGCYIDANTSPLRAALIYDGPIYNARLPQHKAHHMSSTTSKPFGGGRTGDLVKPVSKGGKEKVPLSTHLIAGGFAGLAEALVW